MTQYAAIQKEGQRFPIPPPSPGGMPNILSLAARSLGYFLIPHPLRYGRKVLFQDTFIAGLSSHQLAEERGWMHFP